ncbi:Calpain large subunit, domain iii domain containing protein [Balamuthia mandrillaris]
MASRRNKQSATMAEGGSSTGGGSSALSSPRNTYHDSPLSATAGSRIIPRGMVTRAIMAEGGTADTMSKLQPKSNAIASLRVTIYDVRFPQKGNSAGRKKKGSAGRSRGTPKKNLLAGLGSGGGGEELRAPSFACRVKLGRLRVLPRQTLIPAAPFPTCVGSHVNFAVKSLKSYVEVDVLDATTYKACGNIRVPLTDIPFVHDSIPFGAMKYYPWTPRPEMDLIAGELRIGFKLVKERYAVTKKGEWKDKTAGGSLDYPTWTNNTQYFLAVSVPSVLTINLQSEVGSKDVIGFYVIKVAEINELGVKRKAKEEDIIKTGEHRKWLTKNTDRLQIDIHMQAGCFVVIPCTKYPNIEGEYSLWIEGDYDAGIKVDTFDETTEREEEKSSGWLSDSDDEFSDSSSTTTGEHRLARPSSAKTDSSYDASKSNASPSSAPKELLKFQLLNKQKQQSNLLRAASIGNIGALKKSIAKGGEVNLRDKDGISALTFAAMNGHYECVNLLLAKGADMNSMDSEGYNSVMRAAIGGHATTLKLLLENGGDIRARDPKGFTPFIYAAESGSLECVNVLLEHGANVNESAYNRQTALMKACLRGHSEIVKRLLRKGAKVAFKDTTGQTAVHYACSAGSSECLKLLWSAGANVDVKDSNGETALYKAAIKGHLDVLRLLIEKGEKGSSTSSEGSSSPLSFTPQRALLRNWETVTLLLSHDHASNDGDLGDAIDSVEQLHYQQEGNNLSISTSGNSGRKNSLSLSNSSLNGGEEGGSDIIAQQQHLTLSEKPKKRTMDVLIIITKHGEQHSAFQLVSIDGCVQGFNLFLEGNNEVLSNNTSSSSYQTGSKKDLSQMMDSQKKKAFKKEKKAKKATLMGRKSKSPKESSPISQFTFAVPSSPASMISASALSSPSASASSTASSSSTSPSIPSILSTLSEVTSSPSFHHHLHHLTTEKKDKNNNNNKNDALVNLVAKGQLEILCLLIERGDIVTNYLESGTQMALFYDIIGQDEFENLFLRIAHVLSATSEKSSLSLTNSPSASPTTALLAAAHRKNVSSSKAEDKKTTKTASKSEETKSSSSTNKTPKSPSKGISGTKSNKSAKTTSSNTKNKSSHHHNKDLKEPRKRKKSRASSPKTTEEENASSSSSSHPLHHPLFMSVSSTGLDLAACARDIRKLPLGLLVPFNGPFLATLHSVDLVNLSLVDCCRTSSFSSSSSSSSSPTTSQQGERKYSLTNTLPEQQEKDGKADKDKEKGVQSFTSTATLNVISVITNTRHSLKTLL